MSEYKIVCIDDEKDILEYLEIVFKDEGHDVVAFYDPVEAIEYIKQNKKTILMVFSDFKMGSMDGFDVRKAMLEADISIPFAIFTAYYNTEMAEQAMRYHICEFISKPTDEKKLIEVLNREAGGRIAAIQEEAEMVDGFLEETTPMLSEIEELILALEENPHDELAINTYFRLLHTIKGTASCLGLGDLAHYAHKYEDLITQVKNKNLTVNQKIIDTLLKGYDYLNTMYECEKGRNTYPFDVEKVIKIFDQDFKTVEVADSVSQDAGSDDDARPVAQAAGESKRSEKEEVISVPVSQLTEFLEFSGELTVLKNTIFKSLVKLSSKYTNDNDLDNLSGSIQEMHKVSSNLQNQVSEMKKVSMDSVFRPMKRVVRDSAKVCNKKVRFDTEGESLRVDTAIGKLLNNVLVHMLRNSVDHGVELPQVRKERGKHEEGQISLSCRETGEDIVVEIIDDGNGIDKERIRAKALEKGLYTEEQLNAMSDNRLFNIIFDSGFSTAEVVTAVSGRGVGMDMVRSSIEEMGGRIYIESELGKGSKFILVVPIPRSILIIKSLGIIQNEMGFKIPLDNVAEVIHFEKEKTEAINSIEGSLVLRHHDELIPLIDYGNLLKVKQNDFDFYNIVIVKGEGYKYGLIVDHIEDIEEIVVKKLAHPLNHLDYFLGATFVGDGDLNLILDLEGIAKRLGIMDNESMTDDYDDFVKSGQEVIEDNEYMRFRVGEYTNYSIPLDSVNRLEVFKASDVQFTGNNPVIRYRGGGLPLKCVGSTMGLLDRSFKELEEKNVNLNIIVINSHDHQFGFIIDEILEIESATSRLDDSIVSQDGILGTVFIRDKIISVLDIDYIINSKRNIKAKESKHETAVKVASEHEEYKDAA